jgi:PD-(D/E)XK nuclease superfamily
MRTRWSPSALLGLDLCPRRFALREAGWTPRPNPHYPAMPHAEFGRIWHASAEIFDTAMFKGASRSEATDTAMEAAISLSWADNGAPLGGYVFPEWRCDGGKVPSPTTGRPIQCPASKGWWVEDADDLVHVCTGCAGPVLRRTAFEPMRNHRGVATTKTRPNLLRAVLDYCDEAMPGVVDIGGNPALEIELEFRLAGVDLHCIMDRYTEIGQTRLAHERKSSSRSPWWDGYLQTFQVRFYPEALRQNGHACSGVFMEHYQIANGGTHRSTVTLTPGPDHLQEAVEHMIERVNESEAHDGADPLDWPGRFSACGHAAGGQPCEYLKVCRAAIGRRPELLATEYEQRERTR